ncbi:HAD family hydrolase [Corynebacterium propinquum]|uniref:HAD-IA family hydrolase n=1 Tax=Corynebacterium propinquum TaxID=43769 RepID=UPI000F8993D6|nr:HAD-IA family hydrolase [Corynebacterium propinquum]RUP79264.1 HAD family hydrolase [Corynebacterium propinquum]RUP89388.1 HAD family hydrolase [Corynebacterium propinquum]RUP95417.1 HAD family hydrolase [Corynebacterium propinquum]WKS32500.1 HAD-IA family hydrolase [Corynebacterium propinquum]WKS38986.1 HAD-IA family hydrolase [Corynebacterium propinquum]
MADFTDVTNVPELPDIRVSAAVFDCDGTLVDSEQCWLDLLHELITELGLSPDEFGDVRGITAFEAAQRLSPHTDYTVHELNVLIDARYTQALHNVTTALPGVDKLLRSLHGVVPIAVATNGRREDVVGMLQRSGIANYFDAIITVEDVEHGKPHPEIYQVACERLGARPESTVVFEDSAVGASAAQAAGCNVIALSLKKEGTYPARDVRDVEFDGATARFRITADSRFRLATWNIWWGGQKVRNGQQKISDIIREINPEIICFQECFGEYAKEVSQDIGRQHVQQGFDCAISTGFPTDQDDSDNRIELISTNTEPYATAAWIWIAGTRVLVWSVHLAPWDYGPYAALKGEDPAVMNKQPEEIQRQEQIAKILDLSDELTDYDPDAAVVIAGDFNSPATTDWQQRDDFPDYRWIPTDAPIQRGYRDGFREIYPDANTVWGDTWAPIEPLDSEPRDRIDFVFIKNLAVESAVIRGIKVSDTEAYDPPERRSDSPHQGCFASLDSNGRLIPHQEDNTYPSDHQMVELTLRITR